MTTPVVDSVVTEKVAKGCAACAVGLFGLTLADINTIVQIIAGLLAALAAFVSLYGSFRKWLEKRYGSKPPTP